MPNHRAISRRFADRWGSNGAITPPFKWVIHPNWYTTAGYRAKNNGMLGRSNGCITVDPAENNKIITRLQGALVYVTVGDAPIEQYL